MQKKMVHEKRKKQTTMCAEVNGHGSGRVIWEMIKTIIIHVNFLRFVQFLVAISAVNIQKLKR